MEPCECANVHDRKRIVLTGGPGAGKTAVLELVRKSFCAHVRVLPEAAGIVFGGGFPREPDILCQRAAQRAIFHIERELEAAADAHDAAVVLCDRGTLDGLAYWPGPIEDFWSSLGTTADQQFARYHAVVHLRTPGVGRGYNRQNPLRTESAEAAAAIDERILHAWAQHPRRFVLEPTDDFLAKAAATIRILRGELPECCRSHRVTALERAAPLEIG